MVLLVIALLVTSCHGAQSTREAVAILCGSEPAPDDAHAFHDWLATRITNTEVKDFLSAHAATAPWDRSTEIQRLAARTSLSTCQPLDGLVGIRTANGVDVPALTDSTGTSEMSRAPIVALTPTHIALQGRGRFAIDDLNANLRNMFPSDTALIAADRTLTMRPLVPVLDSIRAAGAGQMYILVTAPNTSRVVELAFRPNPDWSVTVIELGTTTTVNGDEVAPAALRDAIQRAASASGHVVVIAAPGVTVQQLVEVIAAAGGRAYLGASTLIRSVPSP